MEDRLIDELAELLRERLDWYDRALSQTL
jgi:hypothetical protein